MLTEERHDRIRTKLAADGRVLASDLAAEFGVSEDTVRRDLRELARAGACRRVYGGALPPAPDLGTMTQRQEVMVECKLKLASAVVKLISPGQTVFVDAGSTNLAVAQSLPKDLSVTIVTNAPAVALALADHPLCRTILIGGQFDPAKGACLGSQTVRDIERIHADVLVLGTCGIDTRVGASALDAEEAEIKRCMVEQSRTVIVPATADKIGTVAPFAVTGVDRLDHLVITPDVGLEAVDAFAALGVHVHRTP
ncbi:DeoR/GlpR family DNA-binding transcription regulator [Mesorhizobium sp. BAC0120]|uniref:DeoR/GlpR family DNA-binding transcription regulator n=1 Tax=Mesorhizobium sp. BAC0120 TaxID=3090670 RepID=UPI00298C4719|nr:DeoR/GlpR family DNA-binding transcription regulator [Mesorhizobium sp. BAC0120]MDW6022367.1 DeoR/GlpR family DNA-binding transcription regulator [Mesorhizobium sp. BAC0120]